MNKAEAPENKCWACGAEIDAADNFCRKCGKGQGRHISWYYTYWGLIILILLLGPFSLFWVWKSPVLSIGAKWFYTAVVLILMGYVIFIAYQV